MAPQIEAPDRLRYREGGFALVTGAPGTGKSVTLRILAERLGAQRDVRIGIVTRPQAGLADFYREMGDLFGVVLRPHNRWAGAKVLRERWQTHIDASLTRPVLIIDEAHERSLNIDFILGYLRQLLPRRPDLKVIITSATIDPERFSKHFNDAPVIEVSGRTYPVEVRYRPISGPDDSGEDRDQVTAITDATCSIASGEHHPRTCWAACSAGIAAEWRSG